MTPSLKILMYRWGVLTGAAVMATTATLHRSALAVPTTAPASQPAVTRTDSEMSADLTRVGMAMKDATAGGVMADPIKRATAAPTLIPLITQQSALYHEYAAAHNNERAYAGVQQRLEAQLYMLGDKGTVDRVDAAAASTTLADSIPAKSVQFLSRWMAAGRDADAQKAVADDLEKLDAAHPESDPLTMLTYSFANSAASADLKAHLQGVLSDTMKSPMAARVAAAAKAQVDSEAKLNGLAGKPFVLNATTVDGKPFTTDDYKGKVVLVDFWATWCGPCKAGLPEVKEIYGKYHDKGLEIVGVSNDYKADTLKQFTAANGMPWVQLLDASAAADNKWNPTTLGYGIRGIPTMFLVDKKGILRSVTARSELQTLIPTLLAE